MSKRRIMIFSKISKLANTKFLKLCMRPPIGEQRDMRKKRTQKWSFFKFESPYLVSRCPERFARLRQYCSAVLKCVDKFSSKSDENCLSNNRFFDDFFSSIFRNSSRFCRFFAQIFFRDPPLKASPGRNSSQQNHLVLLPQF